MARRVVFTWPAANATGVAALQTLVAASSLSINGGLAIPFNGISTPNFVQFSGISRTISITSTNDLSAVHFTITGTYRNAPQTETRIGPNNATVLTTALFDTVTSVTTDAAAAAVSIGSGTTGQTHWKNSNFQSTVVNMSIEVVVTGTITYSFITTLDEVQRIAAPTTFSPIAAMTAATTNQLGNYLNATAYSAIQITAATTGSLVATFIEQGIL